MLDGDPASDAVPLLGQQSVRQHTCDTTVPVVERVNDEEIEDEEAGKEHGMVALLRRGGVETVDELVQVEIGALGGDRPEPDVDGPVRRAVDHEVVGLLELPARRSCVGPEESMKVQDQADVERLPVRVEQVVEGRPVAGDLLLVPAPKGCDTPVDDPACPVLVGKDDSLDRAGRGHRCHPRPVGELGQQGGKLVGVQLLTPGTDVDVAERADDGERDCCQQSVQVGEGVHRTSQRRR